MADSAPGGGEGTYFQGVPGMLPFPGSSHGNSYPVHAGYNGSHGNLQGNTRHHNRRQQDQWWDSRRQRPKKKNRKDRKDPFTREQKVQMLYEYLQNIRFSPPLNMAEIEYAFSNNALHKISPDLTEHWGNCRRAALVQWESQQAGEQTLSYSMESNPDAGESLEMKHNDQLSDLDRLLDSATFVQPQDQTERVEWLDMKTDDSLGHFYINKVKLNKETESFWNPPHLNGTATQILSFEEITAPASDLQMVLIVNDKQFDDSVDLISTFPKSVAVSMVCPMAYPQDMAPVPRKTEICPVHWREKANYDPDGELMDVGCGCGQNRVIDIVFSRKNRQIKSKLILLRYNDRVRMVIPSCSLNRAGWEYIAQFGWYCDLPVKMDQTIDEGHPLRKDLYRHLRELSAGGIDEILAGVDFSVLSPMVHLVTAQPGNTSIRSKEQFGLTKLMFRKKEFRWPLKVEPVSLCQMYRVGTFEGVYLLEDAFTIPRAYDSQHQNNLKILYPSSEVIRRFLEKHGNVVSEADMGTYFDNLERKCQWWSKLHNVDCEEGVLCHANVLCQYQDVSEDGCPMRRFGWVMTGSQTLGCGSWGGTNNGRLPPDMRSYARYEIGVFLAPYTQCNSGERVTYAVDLNQLGFHWCDPVPYKVQEAPYTPADNTKPGDILYHCIAPVCRVAGDSCYIDEPPLDMAILRLYDRFVPGVENWRGTRWCFLTSRTAQISGLSGLPPVGTVVQFWAVKTYHRNSTKMAIVKVIRTFSSWKEAYEVHGLEYEEAEPAVEIPSLNSLFDSNQGSSSGLSEEKPVKKKTFEEILEENGIKSEEDFDQYWAKQWKTRNGGRLDPAGYFPRPGDDLDKLYPMATMKISNDLAWLEKHVTDICGGRFPVVRGPYSLPYLQTSVTAHLHKHFPGLPADINT